MSNKPNVIMMFIDDLGYGDLSCFNENSQIKTPNIDALAEHGVRFTDCHSTSALCTPSRYGLLTGRYNWRSTLKRGVLAGASEPLIEKGRSTLATMFKKNGYFTAAIGKWHLGLGWQKKDMDLDYYGVPEEIREKCTDPMRARQILDGFNIDFEKPLIVSPNDYGFDYFYGTAASLDQPPYVYIENRMALGIPDTVSGITPLDRHSAKDQDKWQFGPAVTGYDHEAVIGDMHDKVLSVIDEHKDESFFIYYPIHAVHGPILPPKEFRGKSGLNAYADIVLYMDHLVGTMVDELKKQGIYENTLIAFISDNGCSGVADYPLLTSHGHNPSYIFRGMKSEIYEGGHRVPAIISWPGHFDNGTSRSSMVCVSDMYATFAEILGEDIKDNEAEDSVSIIPVLENDKEVRKNIIHSSAMGRFSIRTKDWKLELCPDAGTGAIMGNKMEPTCTEDMPYQLYRLSDDISEKINVAADHTQMCIDMTKDLLEIIENGRSTPGKKQPNAAVEKWEQVDYVLDIMEKMQNNLINK